MKTIFSRRPGASLAYSLPELMVAVGVLVLGTAIALPFFVGDLALYARNFSINKSNNSLRTSLQNLKRDVNMAIEPPILATCTVANGTATVTPLADSATNANAILVWANLGPNYQMLPASGTSGPIKPANGITIVRHIQSSSSDSTKKEDGCAPFPQVGDRILFMSPGPYTKGMPETVGNIQKPGRRITSVTYTNGAAINYSDTTTTNFLIKIDTTNALPVDSSSNSTIPGNNSVTFFRESVYAAITLNDAAGKAVERQLLYYATTNSLTTPKILIRDLDPTPQELDPNLSVTTTTNGVTTTTTSVIQPFNYYSGRGALSPLSVNLPIRALDYARAVGDRGIGVNDVDVSAKEFSLYLRSSTTMAIKARLDDNSLTQLGN